MFLFASTKTARCRQGPPAASGEVDVWFPHDRSVQVAKALFRQALLGAKLPAKRRTWVLRRKIKCSWVFGVLLCLKCFFVLLVCLLFQNQIGITKCVKTCFCAMQLVFANNCAARLDDVGCPKKIQYLDLQVVVIGCVLANWRKKKKRKVATLDQSAAITRLASKQSWPLRSTKLNLWGAKLARCPTIDVKI